jgi:hypothetical protein
MRVFESFENDYEYEHRFAEHAHDEIGQFSVKAASKERGPSRLVDRRNATLHFRWHRST